MNNNYIETPFNFTGSKFKLLDQILPELDYTKPYFVDLFTGGGSIYTNIVDKYEKVLVNDIIKDLIGIHKGLVESDDIIINTKELCKTLKDSQEDYVKLRDSYNAEKNPEKLWALMLSCTSNMMRFSQKFNFNQTWGKRSFNASTENKVENYTNHIRAYKDKIKFVSKPFYEIPISSDKIMFYADPPYGYIKNTNGKIDNKQISEAGYNCYYLQSDDIKLYDYLKKIDDMGSSFMISGVLHHGGKTTWILDKLIQDGFKYKELNCNYEKINKTGQSKETTEVIIKNY